MIKSITSVKVDGKRVIVRAGFDVPLKKNAHHEGWEVVDDTRIKDNLSTLKHLIKNQAKIIILSKLGRPEGKWDENLSMWPVALKLGELLGTKVIKVKDKLPSYKIPHIYFLTEDITKNDYSKLSKEIANGSILFLENMFFYPGEEANDSKFISILKKFGELYVEEAFASAHHKASSNYGLPRELKSYAGISLTQEISSLNKLLRNPAKPMAILMGGAKIHDKVETLENLIPHADHVIIGGALANTFLKAMGYEVGISKISDVNIAKHILRNYKHKLIFPVDVVVSTSTTGKPRLSSLTKIQKNEMVLDIGPASIRKFSGIIKEAKTLIWNGPFGLIEDPRYAFGSKGIAHIFGARSKGFAYGVVGGGETIEVINMAHVTNFVDHVSMGGGAMLDYLAGKKLPGIKVLENA